MSNTYSPSINILRDFDKAVDYIPTSNSKSIYSQIASNFKSGVHSFNIIGSYGTGKSAFLLAFINHLNGNSEIFTPVNGQFNGCKKFKFHNIVGKADSLIHSLADYFEVEKSEDAILKYLKEEHKKLKKQKTCIVIIIDEFGKFLEYAVKNNPDKELYFIQRLSEYANDASRNILFISTLHQNFDAYSIGLNEHQRQEWEKVKGRIKELTFNEPIEQLLKLAADVLQKKGKRKKPEVNKKLLKVINATGIFNLLNDIDKNLIKQLHPMDLLAAMTLTLSLQRYGQNERSLFSFLQTDEYLGLNNFLQSNDNSPKSFYNLDNVYDYLQYNYYSILTSRYNPDYFKWTILRNSLDRVELEISEHIEDAQKLIKTIGLLNIFGVDAAKINIELIDEYSKSCLGIDNAPALISQLEDKNIIRYQSFKSKYKLFEGTDINIEEVQSRAKEEVDKIVNLPLELNPFFQYSFIPAKAVTYKKGTPRIFQYLLSDKPITKFSPSTAGVDGIINLVFDEELDVENFNVQDEPIIYGYFPNTKEIHDQIHEIKSLEKALTLVGNDTIAKNELKELKAYYIESLHNTINDKLFGSSSVTKWYYNGKAVSVESKRKFNSILSDIINEIYPATPVFRNELMNKTKVSSSIHFAKKQFIGQLIENYNKVDLDFPKEQMPAEKTIYYTLLKHTGIHKDNSVYAEFDTPSPDSSFMELWEASENFVAGANVSRRPLTEFVDLLSQRPFKLKDGLLEFWLICFLFIKREDFALYRDGVYIPRITKEVAELFYRAAKKFEIKSFNISGVKLDLYNKYRELTQQHTVESITDSGFQETAKPFLVFYKQLSKYTQQTNALQHDTIAFRKVIKNAKELEKTFFEDLPNCFGLNINSLVNSDEELNDFINRINTSITELRTAEDELIKRIEGNILGILGYKSSSFKKNQQKIQDRYNTVNDKLLNSRQKTFLNRINSKITDRKAWINSLVHAILGKQLNTISDGEEDIIYNRFKTVFKELDNFVELSKLDFDSDNEVVYKIEVTESNNDLINRNIILSKQQNYNVDKAEKEVKKILDKLKDDNVSQAVLIKLLKEINND